MKAIEPIISKMSSKNCPTLIAGDFNINLLKIDHSDETSDFFSTFCTNGFFPQITLPTRLSKRYSSASLIDQIYVKHTLGNLSSSKPGIWLKQISDHKLVFTQIDILVPKQQVPKFILRRNITENSISALKSDLASSYKDYIIQFFALISILNQHFSIYKTR